MQLLAEQTGCTDIYLKSQEIVQGTDVVIRVINLHEADGILNHIAHSIILLIIENKDLLEPNYYMLETNK